VGTAGVAPCRALCQTGIDPYRRSSTERRDGVPVVVAKGRAALRCTSRRGVMGRGRGCHDAPSRSVVQIESLLWMTDAPQMDGRWLPADGS
jgi:hypothetical protein